MTLRRISAALGAVFSLILSTSACSELEQQGCASDEECRVKIGIGSICMSEETGFCSVPTVHHACRATSVPDTLWQTPQLFGTTLTVGGIYDSHGMQLMDAMRVAVDVANIKGGDPTTRLSFSAVFCDLDAGTWQISKSYEDRAEEVAEFLTRTVGARAIVSGVPTPATLRISQKARQHGTVLITANSTGPSMQSELASADKLVWTGNVTTTRMMRHYGNLAVKAHQFVYPDRWPEGETPPTLDVTIITTPNLYTATIGSILTDAVVDGGRLANGDSPLSAVVEVVQCVNPENCTETEFLSTFQRTMDTADYPEVLVLYVESELSVLAALNAMSSRIDTAATRGYLRDAILLLPPVAFSAGAGYAALTDDFALMSRQIFGLHASADPFSEPFTEFDKASDILLDIVDSARPAEFSPHAYDAAWLSIVGISDAIKLAMKSLTPAQIASLTEADVLSMVRGPEIGRRLGRFLSPSLANVDVTGDYTTFNGYRNLLPSQWQIIFNDAMWQVPEYRFRAASGQAAVHPDTHERISYEYAYWHLAAIGNTSHLPDFDNNVNVASECMRGIRGAVIPGVEIFYCPVIHNVCAVDPVPGNIDWLPDWNYMEPCFVSRDAWDGEVR